MLVFENKTLSGHHAFDSSICLAGCTVQGARFQVVGSIYIKRPVGKMVVCLEASKDILFEDSCDVEGSLSAESVASQGPLTVDGMVVAKRIVLIGDSQFTIVQTGELTAQGTVVADSITSQLPVWVDGDLIANSLVCPSVKVERGQLLVRELSVQEAEAQIIANYSFNRLDTSRYRCKWARPMVDGAEPKTTAPADMAANALHVIKAHTQHLPGFEKYYVTDQPPQDCKSFSIYFEKLFSGLKAEYPRLLPATRQFVDCVVQYGFPASLWRF